MEADAADNEADEKDAAWGAGGVGGACLPEEHQAPRFHNFCSPVRAHEKAAPTLYFSLPMRLQRDSDRSKAIARAK